VPVARSVLDSVAPTTSAWTGPESERRGGAGPAYHRGVRTVTISELAEEAGAPLGLVERLVAIGQVRALPDGWFDPGGPGTGQPLAGDITGGRRQTVSGPERRG
jgi:hypothetical protein